MDSTYLRLSIEDACNLRCRYCRPERDLDFGEPALEGRPVLGQDALIDLVAACHRVLPVRKLRLTGGEPLIRADVVELVARLRDMLPEVELCMTTNGTLLEKLADPLKQAGLDRINLSLDTLDADRYRELTRGGKLEQVLAGIGAAKDAGFDKLKLNAVLLESGNGSALRDLVCFGVEQGCEVRFIELMPISVAAGMHRKEFLSADTARQRLAKFFEDLGPAPSSSTASRRRFLVNGQEVTVGFIPSVSHPFCKTCDRLRMDSRGRLFACLRRPEGLDLASALAMGDEAEVERRIQRVLDAKCPAVSVWPGRQMSAIGG